MMDLAVVQVQAAQVLSKQIVENRYFDICSLDKLSKLTKIYPPSEVRSVLDAVHCVDYADMPPDLREFVKTVVYAVYTKFKEEPLGDKITQLINA